MVGSQKYTRRKIIYHLMNYTHEKFHIMIDFEMGRLMMRLP